MKTKFLTCYDYGQGGVWRFVYATCKEQIIESYPELVVVQEIPHWMDSKSLDKLNKLSIDIEDSRNEFFVALVTERAKSN